MREALERDLNRITEQFLRMVSLVREQLQLATAGLVEQDVERAKAAVRLDREVDALELEIENEALAAIARHQPVARDLRFLATVLKALTDLERAGDYAAHVAEDALALSGDPPLKKYIVLGEMAERIETMLDLIAKAIAERDLHAAERVLKLDDDVDDLYEQIVRELLTYMMEDPRTVSRATHLLWVAHNLERIGDRTTNIGERTIFLVTGQIEELNP